MNDMPNLAMKLAFASSVMCDNHRSKPFRVRVNGKTLRAADHIVLREMFAVEWEKGGLNDTNDE